MPKLTVKGTYDYDYSDIERLYSTVFPTQEIDNFFLAQPWMQEWLRHINDPPELVTFYNNETLIGFVFIGYQSSLLGVKAYINQSGIKEFDQVWIEYNDVITNQFQEECRQTLLDYLSAKKGIYQLHISNTLCSSWSNGKWKTWSTQALKAYETDLSGNDVLSHFSKNTKRQINRSKTFIENEMGGILMTWLNKDNFQTEIKKIGELHISQWGEHIYGSGFTNPCFTDFHITLLNDGIGDYVHIAKFNAGDHTLGYLHFFTHNKKVYFYLSAIDYLSENNKFKPGLVMHKMAMEHFQSIGFQQYDYLAGEAQYKASLSSKQYSLFNKILYVNKAKFKPVKLLTNIKRKLKRQN